MSTIERDIARAKALCQETQEKKEDKEFRRLYQEYHNYLESFAYHRLYQKSDLKDVLQIFWLEIWNGAICRYNGSSSLKTFLTSILYYKIKDINTNIRILDNIGNNDADSETIRNMSIKDLIMKGLLTLADTRPEDAYLIRLRNQELSYEDILQQGRKDIISEDERQKEINRLKTRHRRAIKRLKIILKRVMQDENMQLSDYLQSDD